MKVYVVCGVLCSALLGIPAARADVNVGKINFRRVVLDTNFRSEGAGVGDFNHDGRQDIAAGNVYFAAPDWTMHPIVDNAKVYDPHKYSHSFANWADDLNGDGWDDLIVVDYPGEQTWWFENPQTAAGPWKRHVATPVTNNEGPCYLDVDGDGRRELILGYALDPAEPDGPDRYLGFARPAADPAAPWTLVPVSAKAALCTGKYVHGLGVGDLNKDGRNDVAVTDGWWEAPANTAAKDEWRFHSAKLSKPCAQIYVYDFDGDGDNDLLSSSAHKKGIWWHEQTPDGWETHEVDSSFSQSHALCLADINGDGLPDFVTGKRWWAHGPKGDVDPGDPAVLVWFELSRSDGKPVWTPHAIDHDSGVGTQFEVADVNGDGLLDVVTSNKKGTYYFEQSRE